MANEDELDRMQRRRTGGNRRTAGHEAGPQIMNGQDRVYQSPGAGRNPRAQYIEQPSMVRAELEAERARKKKKKKKRRLLIVELLALVVLLGGAYLFFGQKTSQKGYWTIAVFGVDSRDGTLEKGALSDVEMVASIDKATGEIRLSSVFRDTYLKIDSKGTYHKINEAYFKGGHEQAIDALNENLDLKIDDYATFNWKAVAQGINILGGVDIEITDAEFAYINAFITETVNSTGIGSYQLEHAGMNHLDGIQAVSYARLRLMDTDFNRTERQRKVLSLALEKAKQADFDTLKTLVLTVLPQISTSVGVDDILPMAKGVKNYHLGETAGFPFSRTTMKIGKLDCVIPTTLESNVIQLHEFLYPGTAYTPSQAVKSISAKISEVSGIGEPGKNAPAGGQGSGKKPAEQKTEAAAPVETTEETTTAEETAESMETPEEESTSESPEESSPENPTEEDGGLVGPGAEIGGTAGKDTTAVQETPDGPETPEEPKTTEEPKAPDSPKTPDGTKAPDGPDAPGKTEAPVGTEASNNTEGPAGPGI